MRVAIVGSRNYQRLDKVADYVLALPEGTIVISGGATGVDQHAQNVAVTRGLQAVVYLPDYAEFGRRAPLVRNRAIVLDCDRLVAFWDGESRGTLHAWSEAKLHGKPAELIR